MVEEVFKLSYPRDFGPALLERKLRFPEDSAPPLVPFSLQIIPDDLVPSAQYLLHTPQGNTRTLAARILRHKLALPPGTYAIEARAEGYAPFKKEVVVT